MISITPQGDIYLCKTPLENDYKNQLTFSNATAQLTYFNSKIDKTLNNYTYIKHDNVIKVGFPIDEIINCNYLFYRNEGFTTKYYYCFITNMEYVNENCTAITFETDVWQTYQFNLTFNPCFVEREHVNNDTVGLHTIPEDLELGDYVVDDIIKQLGLGNNDGYYILSSTFIPYLDANDDLIVSSLGDGGQLYNGIYSGLVYTAFSNSTAGITKLKKVLHGFAKAGRNDDINSIFVAPSLLIYDITYEETGVWGIVNKTTDASTYAWESLSTPMIYKPSTLNGYTPANKKLLTYPYCYLLMNNGNGANAIYKYELFKNNQNYCDFSIAMSICPGMSIILRPHQYETTINFNHKADLIGGKYPTCNWLNDSYTNWLTQNALNIKLGIAQGALQTGTGVAEANPMKVVGGLSNIGNLMKDVYLKREYTSPQSEGNINCGDVNFSSENTSFTAYKMSIKSEFAQIIDKYFSMFGYKVNTVKTPNITGRSNWNYIKTVDCNFEGDIPQEHLQIIKQIFNNGITLWHNPATMYNYNNPNIIM